ncbi:MAG: hypothetical protein AMJ88_02860 [Anaerolineae bacterium SM23_ 63]|nr:MAG: hypothetical protein AMJ88_02860 [Anaerolineae bacterium SM23_ 63]HEY46962.1 hypothetical protein [Anaerolineae bacterium]
MFFQQASFWLSTTALYLGYGAVMGILLKATFSKPHSHPYWALAITHGFFFFLPASILLLGHQEWSVIGRYGLLSTGLIIMILSTLQPNWVPTMIWQRAFGQRYFTVVLALIMLWGISAIFATHTFTPILISIPASLVGAASWQMIVRSS